METPSNQDLDEKLVKVLDILEADELKIFSRDVLTTSFSKIRSYAKTFKDKERDKYIYFIKSVVDGIAGENVDPYLLSLAEFRAEDSYLPYVVPIVNVNNNKDQHLFMFYVMCTQMPTICRIYPKGVEYVRRFEIDTSKKDKIILAKSFDFVKSIRIPKLDFPVKCIFTIGVWTKTLIINTENVFVDLSYIPIPQMNILFAIEVEIEARDKVLTVDFLGLLLMDDDRMNYRREFLDNMVKNIPQARDYGFNRNCF